MKSKKPFICMILSALIGAAVGLVAGLVFGLLINLISFYLSDPRMMGNNMFMPGAFLGMGTGTFLGAILGGIAGLKKHK